ncbi:hypothetical protein ACMG4P_24755 [Pseudovibrio denitrificans]|uniref:hypothetical protein n=1 Tax=Pseudovibrio denitrificans TaxID=258256 RepID=UPI0039BFAA8C
MTSKVTIQAISDLKKIPTDKLIEFGLRQTDQGVEFSYTTTTGSTARPRLRHGIRGAGGSSWTGDEALPITMYTPPEHLALTQLKDLIIVEGESDCWSGWLNGFRVIGIPGADRVKSIEPAHIKNAHRIFIQREHLEGCNTTYPEGVDVFVDQIIAHIIPMTSSGEIFVLELTEPHSDLSDLHVAQPIKFQEILLKAMSTSEKVHDANG